MRIDKFLKVSRIIKRRTVANEACDREKICVNGRQVKAGYQVKPGDIVEICFGSRSLKIEVLEILENPGKDEAATMYREIRD